jgi:hypothetical protein
MMSPVYSGAYVKSFSFKANKTSSRGRGQDQPLKMSNKSVHQSLKGLQGFKPLWKTLHYISNPEVQIKTLTLRNDSPHAKTC